MTQGTLVAVKAIMAGVLGVTVVWFLADSRAGSGTEGLDRLESRIVALEGDSGGAAVAEIRALLEDARDALDLVFARLERMERIAAIRARADAASRGGAAIPRRRAPDGTPRVIDRIQAGPSASGFMPDSRMDTEWGQRVLGRRVDAIAKAMPDLTENQKSALRDVIESKIRESREALRELRGQENRRARHREALEEIEARHDEQLRAILNEDQYRRYRAMGNTESTDRSDRNDERK